MPRYIVERSFPEGLKIPINDEGAEICRMVVMINEEESVTWIQSYVSADGNKSFCAYDAPSPEAIRRAARRNNLPIDRITRSRIGSSAVVFSDECSIANSKPVNAG